MRIRHDLLGCANRMRKTAGEFREAVEEIRETWRDATADKFFNRDLKDIDVVADHLVAYLQEATEFVNKIDQQLKDEQA